MSAAEEAQFERELHALREKAVADLERLDDERQRLQELIAFIDGYGRPGKARRPKRTRPQTRRRRTDSLLEIVQQRPGVRASMLAMVTDREVDDVNAELDEHERAGKVQRQGLGWRLSGR